MKQVTLGKTGITVPQNGFGALPIQRISQEDAVYLLRKAYAGGMRFFDTARTYSNSETKVGAAFGDGYIRREDIVIATKTAAKTPEDFWKDLDRSLTELKTDYIDIYQFHMMGSCSPDWDGARPPCGSSSRQTRRFDKNHDTGRSFQPRIPARSSAP